MGGGGNRNVPISIWESIWESKKSELEIEGQSPQICTVRDGVT